MSSIQKGNRNKIELVVRPDMHYTLEAVVDSTVIKLSKPAATASQVSIKFVSTTSKRSETNSNVHLG